MMFRARSRPTLGMRRKLAGIVPFPVFITSNTELISYKKTSVTPLDAFVAPGMTSVNFVGT